MESLSGRMIVGAALLGALSAPPLTVAAGPPPVPGAPVQLMADDAREGLWISLDAVQLEPVTAIELAGGTALPEAGARLPGRSDGAGLRAEAGLQVTPLRTTIERELPALWEYRRRIAAGDRSVPRVRVAMEAAGGRDQLAGERSGATLPVRVRPTHITRRQNADGTETFSGGVILEIPVEGLGATGRFRGRLWITVEEG